MKIFKLWLPVIIWCGVIFYLSGLPNLETKWEFWDFILRKLAHITEYLILAFLLYRAFRGSFKLSSFYLILYSGGLSLLYAISDEVHQLFVPTRSGNFADVLTDSLGIIIFYIILKKKSLQKSP